MKCCMIISVMSLILPLCKREGEEVLHPLRGVDLPQSPGLIKCLWGRGLSPGHCPGKAPPYQVALPSSTDLPSPGWERV